MSSGDDEDYDEDYDIWNKIDNLITTRAGGTVGNTGSKTKDKKYSAKLDIYITRSGTYIDARGMPMEILKKIKNYYTIKNKNIMGYFDININYRYDTKTKRLYIPRFGSFILKNKFADIKFHNSIERNNPLTNLNFGGKFQGNQELIFNTIIKKWFSDDKLKGGKAGLILNLQAGMGKTFLAMGMIGFLNCRTLIVVHNRTILHQWKKLLNEFFPDATIGAHYGNEKKPGDIVVGVINSLIMTDMKIYESPRAFYDSFDFVIFDEAHEYCSSQRKGIYNIGQCPYMLGLSATPKDRSDGLDTVNFWGIGPVLNASGIPGYTEKGLAFTGHVTRICYSGPNKYTKMIMNEALNTMSFPLMVEQLTRDPFRLKLIAELIMEQHKNNYNIFVFADRRKYLLQIEAEAKKLHFNILYMTNNEEAAIVLKEVANVLKKLALDNDLIVGNEPVADISLKSIRLVGGSTEAEMEDAKKNKTIILSTYQYMATGTSIPKMNAVILATPRKTKIRQIIGRIFRLGSDHSITRQIIDVVDYKTGLKNQWYKRKAYYKEQGYTMEDREVSFLDIKL